ncbi:penicillin-binding protein transpeptidase [Clostridium sp. CAG:793]|nr:penicillin-binding protein transpeptidase [Clostridium sp. CAG:793]
MGKGKIIPINKKAKEDNRIQKTVKVSIKRLKGFLVFIFIVFIALVARIGAIQFIDGTWLKERAYSQSTSSTVVSAKRGTIYDSNGKALAISAEVDTVSVNPEYLVVKEKGEVNQEKTQELREKMAQKFAEIFSLEYDDVLKKLNSSRSVETIASKVETDKVTTLKAWLKENKISSGVNIDEDVKRYYPYNNLASNLIGFCGTNNQGLDGIELSYDDELKGTNGKLITAISVIQTAIPDQNEQYIAPENGSNIYLTIDSNIQTIVEKYLKQAVEENNCQRGGNAIAVNPENGEILAMATYPDYNLNDPYTPNESLSKGWDKLSSQEQSNKLYSMWRNRAVLDTYEPGSTFKIIAASIGLEEKIVETDTAGDFYCGGSETVSGTRISCANRSGHGSQSLRNALENSCNPALIQLGQRIGVSTFYKYLDAFGFFKKTGIDLPSEGTSSFWKEKNVGPVELATMSFGQRFTITPMQLVKAAAAIANEGKLVTPHVVKEIENPDTGTVKTIQTNEERQVISEDTANKIKDMMKSVVETGGGKYAQVKGYEIGGKTGTSEADPNHPENGYVASFLAIAPVDNTKIVLLLTLYAPKVRNYYGGSIAAPAVSQMLSEILPYLDIPSNNSDEGNVELVSVPNVTNKTIAEAQKILKAAGLEYSSVGDADNIVSEQVPKSGTQLQKNGIVKIYAEGKDERVSQTVPDLKGVSLAQAKVMLKARNLNISSKGTGIVIAQDPKAGTSVDEGTVINVTLQEATTSGQH